MEAESLNTIAENQVENMPKEKKNSIPAGKVHKGNAKVYYKSCVSECARARAR